MLVTIRNRFPCRSTIREVPIPVSGVDVGWGLASNCVDDIEVGPFDSAAAEHVVKPMTSCSRKWKSSNGFGFACRFTHKERAAKACAMKLEGDIAFGEVVDRAGCAEIGFGTVDYLFLQNVTLPVITAAAAQ